MFSPAASLILSSANELFKVGNNIDSIGEYVPIPKFSVSTIKELCHDSVEVLKKEETLIRIKGNYVIVGDIHGNLKDLIRIIIDNGLPPLTNYLFLGDYVDRGSFSTEVFAILFAMKVLYPENVFLLRGNHETKDMSAIYGLLKELEANYGHENGVEIWKWMNNAFDYLPLVCILNESCFCVHGGISERLTSLHTIEKIQKPIDPKDLLIDDLLWSDPCDSFFSYGANTRGKGCIFGMLAISQFLHTFNMKNIIRGHECVMGGVDIKCYKKFYTVFSSSGYVGQKNRGGVLICNGNDFDTRIYRPLTPIKRDDASFFDVTSQYFVEKDNSQPTLKKLELSSFKINFKNNANTTRSRRSKALINIAHLRLTRKFE